MEKISNICLQRYTEKYAKYLFRAIFKKVLFLSFQCVFHPIACKFLTIDIDFGTISTNQASLPLLACLKMICERKNHFFPKEVYRTGSDRHKLLPPDEKLSGATDAAFRAYMPLIWTLN